MDSLLHDDDVRSGANTDTMRVLAQKVYNFRSDRWITLKVFDEFPYAVFYGLTWNRYFMTTTSGREIPPTRPEYRLERSITLDPTIRSRSNFLRSFRRLLFMD